MIILEHGENGKEESETLGVFLNRPTDLVICVDEYVWRIWYGGPVNTGRNIAHLLDTSKLICLHSLLSVEARKESKKVVRDVYKTTFENAKKLVTDGFATVDDFLVLIGYCGWCQASYSKS